MEKLLGGSIGAVALRLILLSILVGVVMAALGLEPRDLIFGIKDVLWTLYNMGFGVFNSAFGYFLAGAIIVFPLWFISRLFRASPKSAARNKSQKDGK